MRETPVPDDTTAPRLLRIQEVGADLGLTPRSIRYYEEIGLLRPAARSGGAYRLYDADDVERLRFIKGLRDDAGFSLAEISQLIEDEDARARNRATFHSATDPTARRAAIVDTLGRLDRRVETLGQKVARLEAMIAETEVSRVRLRTRIDEIDTEIAAPAAPAASPARPRRRQR